MSGVFASNRLNLFFCGTAICLFTAFPATAQNSAGAGTPDFQSGNTGWVAMNQDLAPPPSGIGPTKSDPAHPYIPNGRGQQPTFRIADVDNPNLKPWAAEAMRKSNAEVLAGKIAFTARSSCMPAGVPGFSSFIVEPIFFMQSPKEILMVYSGDQQVRRIWMNVPHSQNPRPSWYGESVGHYEGDTLVVDTIGLNAKTFVDNYRTPHSEKLHVIERYRLTNNGQVLENLIWAEDPDTFNQPWSGIQRYRKEQRGPLDEQVCAENNAALFDYSIPQARTADF
jgi:hypothetical protein